MTWPKDAGASATTESGRSRPFGQLSLALETVRTVLDELRSVPSLSTHEGDARGVSPDRTDPRKRRAWIGWHTPAAADIPGSLPCCMVAPSVHGGAVRSPGANYDMNVSVFVDEALPASVTRDSAKVVELLPER